MRERTTVACQTRPRAPGWLLAMVLMVVTFALYWPAIHYDFVSYDDDLYVLENAHVTSGLTWGNVRWAFGSSYAANWHPLAWLSHMLDCELFGVKPWGHHFTNGLIHALNAALVFLLLQQLTGAVWRSLCLAALFALHPLRVESVAWVAERKDVLSSFFGLLALLFYARYAARRQLAEGQEPLRRAAPTRRTGSDYALALCCLALSLMSKPMLVTWPFVMLLLDYWPLNRIPSASFQRQIATLKRLAVEKIPFFVLAALACVVTFWAQKSGGTVRTLANLSLGARAGNALISYLRYLQKVFWPADLAVFYPMPERWPLEFVLLAAALLFVASVVLWVERRHCPFLLVGWLWFIGTLVPVIGLVQVGDQAMADRYTYLPSIGLLLLVIWGVSELAGRWRSPRITLLAAGSTGLILIGLTREQLAYWKDGETLFRHALAVTENNYPARNNLGVALAGKNQFEEAIAEYQEAIRLRPDGADALYNLGNLLGSKGRIDEAMALLQQTLRLKPDHAEAHHDLGMALATKGRMDEAIREFREALDLKSDYAAAHSHLGAALSDQRRIDEAIHEFRQALLLNPGYAEVHNKLGSALSLKGQAAEAISHYREAIRLRPDYAQARYNLGNALGSKGQFDEAIILLQEAIRLKPDYAEAHNDLGLVLAMEGKTDEAIRHFQEALRLRPSYAAARKNLDNARAAKGGSSDQPTPPAPP